MYLHCMIQRSSHDMTVHSCIASLLTMLPVYVIPLINIFNEHSSTIKQSETFNVSTCKHNILFWELYFKMKCMDRGY